MSANWLPDGRFWYNVNVPGGKEYVLINPADGSRKTGADKKSILPDMEGVKDAPPAMRRSFSNEIASPDGKKLAFLKDWNLWVRDTESKEEKQLTKDGIKDFGAK